MEPKTCRCEVGGGPFQGLPARRALSRTWRPHHPPLSNILETSQGQRPSPFSGSKSPLTSRNGPSTAVYCSPNVEGSPPEAVSLTPCVTWWGV